MDDFYVGLSETLLGPDVRLGSYHLFLLGVHPAHQGKGVAHRLFSAIDDIVRILVLLFYDFRRWTDCDFQAISRGIAQTVEATGKKAVSYRLLSSDPYNLRIGKKNSAMCIST